MGFVFCKPVYSKDCTSKDFKTQVNCLTDEVGRLSVEIAKLTEEKNTIRNSERLIVIPKNTIAAFNLEFCPNGWKPLPIAQGRYLVGLQKNGTLLGTGGKALANLENRVTGKHGHEYTKNWVGGSGKGLSWNADPRSAKRNSAQAGTSTIGNHEGTNAPYLQVLMCEKK